MSDPISDATGATLGAAPDNDDRAWQDSPRLPSSVDEALHAAGAEPGSGAEETRRWLREQFSPGRRHPGKPGGQFNGGRA